MTFLELQWWAILEDFVAQIQNINFFWLLIFQKTQNVMIYVSQLKEYAALHLILIELIYLY